MLSTVVLSFSSMLQIPFDSPGDHKQGRNRQAALLFDPIDSEYHFQITKVWQYLLS